MHENFGNLLTVYATTPQTTRPKIAYWSFVIIAFSIIVTQLLWAYAVATANSLMVETIMNGWPFIVGLNGTLATLLLRYFGVLKQEQKNKLDAANGNTQPSGVMGLLTTLVNRNGK